MPDNVRISVAELQRRMDQGEDFVLLDSRNPQAWAQSDVKLPRAIRVPANELDNRINDIPRDKPIVTYCT